MADSPLRPLSDQALAEVSGGKGRRASAPPDVSHRVQMHEQMGLRLIGQMASQYAVRQAPAHPRRVAMAHRR